MANWCRRQAPGGDAAVAARRRGRRAGEQRALLPHQELDLASRLRNHLPEVLGLPGHLWTRQGVADVIERWYGTRLSTQSVGRYLRSWGLGPRKPTDRACQLCVDTVAGWLEREYPIILKTAQLGGAQVCWIGRSRLCGTDPVAELVSAVATRGSLRFMICDGRPDFPLPVEFLDRLVRHDGRPVHAVVDGSWAHLEWPRRLPDGVVLHALPTCGR